MKISLEIYIYTGNFLMIKEIESAYLEVCVCVCYRWYFCLSMCVSLYVCMLQRERCLNKGFTPEGASNSEKSFSNSTKNKIWILLPFSIWLVLYELSPLFNLADSFLFGWFGFYNKEATIPPQSPTLKQKCFLCKRWSNRYLLHSPSEMMQLAYFTWNTSCMKYENNGFAVLPLGTECHIEEKWQTRA